MPERGSTPLRLFATSRRYAFEAACSAALANEPVRSAVRSATERQDGFRRRALAGLPDAEALRSLAADIRRHTLEHLDSYLVRFEAHVRARGGKVHLARGGSDVAAILKGIIRSGGLKSCIKSKSMAGEEIDLAQALKSLGLEVTETDLGEFIAQASGRPPSHIVAPIIHLSRQEAGKVLTEHLQAPFSDDPAALTRLARLHLRDKFRSADLGITGGNFLIAETGQVVVIENEGNARHSLTAPRVLVCLVGIEKLLPRLADLSVFLKLLARSATGQTLTGYTNLFSGPRIPGELDGPEEFHVILLDNSRSDILASDYRETLACIRCAACLNACPVYRNIGGHAYGNVYPGPIGAMLAPLMHSLSRFRDLPGASTLCGACAQACPVRIDIPRHLIRLRADMTSARIGSRRARFACRLAGWMLSSPQLYRLLSGVLRLLLRPGSSGWVERAPLVGRAWTEVRPLPAPAKKTFHQLWKERRK